MKISVITVSYNSGFTLEECIRSVLCQRYDNVEYIVIDGCSTDSTEDVLTSYRGEISTLLVEPDSGIYDAMNKGIKLATGDAVGFLNADDLYANEHVLGRVAGVLDGDDYDSCFGDLVYVGGARGERRVRCWKAGSYYSRKFYWGWMPPHPTFFVRREAYEKFGLYECGFGTSADYELMLRLLLRHGLSAGYIPEVLVKMRVGGASNSSIRNRVKANIMDRKAWKANGLEPLPWTLWLKPARKIPQWLTWTCK